MRIKYKEKSLFGVEGALSRRCNFIGIGRTSLLVLGHLSQHIGRIIEGFERLNFELVIDLGNSNTKDFDNVVGGMSFKLLAFTNFDRQITAHGTPMSPLESNNWRTTVDSDDFP